MVFCKSRLSIAYLGFSYVQYRDKVTCAKAEALRLRHEGADLVIALTHQREANDRELLRRVPEIDLALGGHDHFPLHATEAGTGLVKSGADCRSTSFVEVWRPEKPGAKASIHVEFVELTSSVAEGSVFFLVCFVWLSAVFSLWSATVFSTACTPSRGR